MARGFPANWSPDGEKIAYISTPDPKPKGYVMNAAEIYVMNADGSEQRRLTRNRVPDHAGAWSPDGQMIAFVRAHGDHWDIYVMNPDGSGSAG